MPAQSLTGAMLVTAVLPFSEPRGGVSARNREEVYTMAYYAPSASRARPGVSILLLLYLVAGGIVAATHHYWSNLHTLTQILSAVLATVLWPLILLGVNLHIH
jgi:hypothetical protein